MPQIVYLIYPHGVWLKSSDGGMLNTKLYVQLGSRSSRPTLVWVFPWGIQERVEKDGEKMVDPFPNRKHPRLKSSVYNKAGMYFVTICTKERSPCLGKIIWNESDMMGTACCALSEVGAVVQKYVCSISAAYPYTVLDTFMIMPDHVYLLLCFQEDTFFSKTENTRSPSANSKLVNIIRSCKTLVTKELGYSIWQTSFYDSIVRNEEALYLTRRYIMQNPARWAMRYGGVPE